MSLEAKQPKLLPSSLKTRLRATFEAFVFSSALYRLLIGGATPEGLVQSLTGPAGDARRGSALLQGEFAYGSERVAGGDLFGASASEEMMATIHGFTWLADLAAEGSPEAREHGRALVRQWLGRFGEWSLLAWRGDVLGQRISAWLAAYRFLAEGADDAFRIAVLRSLARQVRHLERLGRLGGNALGPDGFRRLAALAALVHASTTIAGGKERLAKALVLFLREIDRQVLPDGGHCERSPPVQLALVELLVRARKALLDGKHTVPSALQGAIDRTAPMLRFFRHGDGRFALFNHASEGDADSIEAVLASTGAEGKAPAGAPHIGFQRMEAGRFLVLIDAGAPPPAGWDAHAHAGTLSFEASQGGERVIVNCGARPFVRGEWLAAQRATAAHSILVLSNANSSEIMPDGQLGRRPRHVICRREEADGAILIDGSHDGYAPPFGVLHRRRFYLSADGADLRGEDRLSRVRPGPATAFALRFHLHPDVRISLLHDGTAALLRLPSGAGFRFDASGGRLAIEESIYLGASIGPRRTEQIVVESTLAGEEALVKWALKRVGEAG